MDSYITTNTSHRSRVSALHDPGSNFTDPDVYDINDAAIAIAVPVVFAIIFITGLIGNGCVIGAVLRYKSMRSAPNFFIVNLAVGDVLLILISVPTSATIYTLRSWSFGLALCKISYFIKTLSLGLSIFTLTALSIDRALVISQTTKLRQEKTTQRIIVMVIIVWVLSLLVAIPDAITYHLSVKDNVTYCLPHPVELSSIPFSKIHATAHIAVFFILPLIIITVCYSIMACIMVRNSNGIPGESLELSTWRMKQVQARKKVANIVIVLIVLFFICWLPRSVYILIAYYSTNKEMTPAIYYFRIVAYCLQFLNCCVNPVALYFLSKTFKTYYMKQFCCGSDRVKSSDTDLTTKQSNLLSGESQPLNKLAAEKKLSKQEHTDQSECFLRSSVTET